MNKKAEKRQALITVLIVFLMMGFAGWYENYVPAQNHQDNNLPKYATARP